MGGKFPRAPVFQIAFSVSKKPCRGHDFPAHGSGQFPSVAGAFRNGGFGKFGHFDFHERGDSHAVEVGIGIEHHFRYRSAIKAEQVRHAVFHAPGSFGESQGFEKPDRVTEGIRTEPDLLAGFDSPA